MLCLPIAITGIKRHRICAPFQVTLPPCEPPPLITYSIIKVVIAVDGNGTVDLREAWKDRCEAPAVMRKLICDTALVWGIGGVVIGGVLTNSSGPEGTYRHRVWP